MPITPLPSPPVRNVPATFADLGDAFLGALPAFVTEANALETNVNAKEVSAVASALAAYNSEQSIVSGTNVIAWVSGTTYVAGNVRWSPINFQSYRRKTGGAGTTDPSADSTNWVQLSTVPVMTGHIGEVLYTDGSTAYWSTTLLTLSLTAPAAGKVLTATSGTAASWVVQAAPALFNQLNYGGF